MTKSSVRKIIQRLCKSSITQNHPKACDTLVDDVIVKLRAFGHKVIKNEYYGEKQAIHLSVLVLDVFGAMVYAAADFKRQVALFDKKSYVTLGKQPEQDKRDEKVTILERADGNRVRAVLTLALKKGRLDKLAFNKKEWAYLVSERESRAFVITAVSRHAASILPAMLADHSGVPADHEIVIDYEDNIDSGKLEPPLVVTQFGCTSNETMKNNLGEFDVAAEHWLGQSTIVESVDTDMWPIFVLKHIEGRKVVIKTKIEKKEAFFHPEVFREWLLSNNYDVCDFVRMYIWAGSDFVPGCPGMSAERCMNNFMQQPQISPRQVISASIVGCKKGAKLHARLKQYDIDSSEQRTDWCLNYWLYSVCGEEQKNMLYPTPVGHGFSLQDGRIMYTEDIANKHLQPSRKRVKMSDAEGILAVVATSHKAHLPCLWAQKNTTQAGQP